MSLPAILHVGDLRKLTGWSDQKVQRYMDRNSLSRREQDGTRFTTPDIIDAVMPDALRAMARKWDALQAGEEFDPKKFDDLAEEDE